MIVWQSRQFEFHPLQGDFVQTDGQADRYRYEKADRRIYDSSRQAGTQTDMHTWQVNRCTVETSKERDIYRADTDEDIYTNKQNVKRKLLLHCLICKYTYILFNIGEEYLPGKCWKK